MAPAVSDADAIDLQMVADFACPWCYIGLKRLDQAGALRPTLPIRLHWRPFLLNPNLPAEGMDRASYLRLKFGGEAPARRIYERVEEAGRAAGIPFAFGRMQRTPNTLQAHRVVLFAAALNRTRPLIDCMFRALFVDGRDIGAHDTLVELALEAGLNADALRTHLASGTGADDVLRSHILAERQGIQGVPVFITGRHGISGAQPPEVLSALLDIAAAARAS